MLTTAPHDTERLVILLHGIGGTGSMLMPIAESWRHVIPSTRFAAPNAPYRHSLGYGYQWFGMDAALLQPDRLEEVRGAFDQTIRDILVKEGFEGRPEHVIFVGVSQGAIMALDGVASGRWRIGALVCFAGLLSPTPVSRIAANTPVLLVHGAIDRTIPAAASEAAARALRGAGFDVTLDIMPDAGHTVTLEGARKALDFLRAKAFSASA